jgi:plasmid stability protein
LTPASGRVPGFFVAASHIRYRDIIWDRRSLMAQFVVRQLEEDVKEGLKRRAKRHGRSMEDEVRHVLRDAARGERRAVRKLGSRIAARFRKVGFRTELPEWRRQSPSPIDFDS